MPEEDYDLIADVANSGGPRREPREVLLAALSQARALTTIVNSSLKVSAASSADLKNGGNLNKMKRRHSTRKTGKLLRYLKGE